MSYDNAVCAFDYQRYGVIVFRNVIPTRLIEAARVVAYDLYESCGGRFAEHGSFPMDGKHATSCHVLPRFAEARELLAWLPVRDVFPAGPLAVVHSKFSYKEVGTGRQWDPHQDAAYKPEVRSGFVFAVPLEECNKYNGTLQVYLGARRLLPHKQLIDSNLLTLERPLPQPPVALALQPGDVVAFSLYTVHQSGPNVSRGLRAMMFVEMEPYRSTLTDDIGGAPIVVDP